MKKTIVNTFIAGSPKCGTTALYSILNRSKIIFFPEYKEPHFFADDLGGYKAHDNIGDFHSLYSKLKDEKIVGDASIFNLYSNSALKNIKNYNPDAKIILMLRNPVDAVPSFHGQLLYTQDENIESLEEAWDLSGKRVKGVNALETCKCEKILDYKKIYCYGTQLEKLYSIFDREQVHVVIYDKFKNDYEGELVKLFSFLDIKYEFIENEIVNENTKNRINWFARLLRRPPKFLVILKRLIMGRGENFIYRFLLNLNTKKKLRDPVSDELKYRIYLNYKSEIAALESILGMKLDEWKI
ncbi:sulfotransferase domain-containing protein [Pseudoalteromonas sp. DY56-GL22]|uniref:sulfotransferase family protein n=1 Tax=Pseudoalteromonas sp. DY56-GL22 TaxID=2967126 RepID=UPI00352A3F4B